MNPTTATTARSKARRKPENGTVAISTVKSLLQYFVLILLLSNVLVYQLAHHPTTANKVAIQYLGEPLIPSEKAVPLPSLQQISDLGSVDRKHYGGEGDPVHLGGFVNVDRDGVSPWVWKDMITYLGIKSLLDVGCGKGVSTLWFQLHGVKAVCVEGSKDALRNSLLQSSDIIDHDYSRGPWWPSETVDVIWSVEFLEHVGRYHEHNYLRTFEKAALLFVTSSQWGGWHHVEAHYEGFWRDKLEAHGFVYSDHLTRRYRQIAERERAAAQPFVSKDVVNEKEDILYGAFHLIRSLQIYLNPKIASLERHNHLFAESGCIERSLPFPNNTEQMPNEEDGTWHIIRRKCGTGKGGKSETPLPPELEPLSMNEEMDQRWHESIVEHLIAGRNSKTK